MTSEARPRSKGLALQAASRENGLPTGPSRSARAPRDHRDQPDHATSVLTDVAWSGSPCFTEHRSHRDDINAPKQAIDRQRCSRRHLIELNDVVVVVDELKTPLE